MTLLSDALLILGLGCVVAAGFLSSLIVGLILLGFSLIFLAVAVADTKHKVRLPWRRS